MADPGNGRAPTAGNGRGAELGRLANDSTTQQLRAVLGLLPVISLEARVALDVARDLHLTGGCEIEDGKRLATAYKRLKRANEVIGTAEQGVHRHG